MRNTPPPTVIFYFISFCTNICETFTSQPIDCGALEENERHMLHKSLLELHIHTYTYSSTLATVCSATEYRVTPFQQIVVAFISHGAKRS